LADLLPPDQEERLIRRLKERDEQAFRQMIKLYQQRIYQLIFRMLSSRQEAEDIGQEVFVTVFKSIESFRGDSKFSTWLYRIAINHCKNRIKYLKRRDYHRAAPLDEVADREAGAQDAGIFLQSQVPAPDQMVEGLQIEAILQRELANLDEEHRSLIILRDVENLSYEEIAQITLLPEGTVKSRLHRARMALKERLEKHLK
jgi:RNA polymerase sigma-70 factor (ECF subfamily)